MRPPRRTVRLRLTVLYGALFLVCGAGLLAVTYVLLSHSALVTVSASGSGRSLTVTGPGLGAGQRIGISTGPGTASDGALPPSPGQLDQQMRQLQAAALAQHTAEMHQLLVQSGLVLAIMAVISAGLGWIVAGRVLRPLRTITSATRRISARNLHERLALDGPDDDLKELGDTIDALLGRLEAAFDAQRRFVANASHELRTPLARERTVLEVALRDPDASTGSLRRACQRVLASGEQQERLIEALLTLARSQRGLDQRTPVDLATATRTAVAARRDEAGAAGLTVRAELAPAPADGDPRLAERLAANLVGNAIQHNQPGGWVEVRTGTRDGRAVLTVANSGPVVPAEDTARLLQPFQRTGPERAGAREGLGLGLSIVEAISTAHGAVLSVRPRLGGGLVVEVSFPPARVPALAG